MNLYFLVPLLALVALVQSTLVPFISILDARPNLMLLVVIAWTLEQGSPSGLIWAFVGGLWLDLLSGTPLGVSAMGLLVVALVAGIGSRNLFRGHLVILLLSALIGGLLFGGIFLALMSLFGRPTHWVDTVLRVILPNAVYDAALMPIVNPATIAFGRFVATRRSNL